MFLGFGQAQAGPMKWSAMRELWKAYQGGLRRRPVIERFTAWPRSAVSGVRLASPFYTN